MADPDLDVDADLVEARRRLQEIGAQARQNHERSRVLAEEARYISADARSARGEVTVRAGVGGRIDAITFGASAERLALDHLARLTVRTIADAQHGAMKQLAEHGASQFGADSDIARSLYRDAEAGYPPTTHTLG